ncbi:hypothetical protein KCU91_g155, partial [Aureobasidium melanogenum]
MVSPGLHSQRLDPYSHSLDPTMDIVPSVAAQALDIDMVDFAAFMPRRLWRARMDARSLDMVNLWFGICRDIDGCGFEAWCRFGRACKHLPNQQIENIPQSPEKEQTKD